ncbi:MAG: RNA-binding S4 domain-containing protein [Candidatus Cryptobacteroides sp.]
MRIDKYLWAIRVFKTRSEATEACNGGKVKIDGVNCKPAKEVKLGEIIQIRKGSVLYSYRVIAPLENRVGASLVHLYAENLTPESELAKMKAPVETFFVKRDRGSGRPTKKERRVLDSMLDFLDEEED